MNEALQFILDINNYNSKNKFRLGMARVRSVEGDPVFGTATGQAMIVPASGEWDEDAVPAYYLGEYPPRPGGACWYATDGRDRIILGMMAPDGPPTAQIALSVASTSIPNDPGAGSAIALGSVIADPWNMANGSGITTPIPGMYIATGWLQWSTDTLGGTGYRQVAVFAGGTNILATRIAPGTTTQPSQSVTTPVFYAPAGVNVEIRVRQNRGTAQNVTDASLSVHYVGRRRTAGAGPEELADGSFEAAGTAGWDFTQTTAIYSLSSVNPYDGDYCLQGVHGNGSALTSIVYGPDKIPVVPGAQYTVSAYVRGTAAITASGSAGVVPFLLCAPDGLPDPTDSTSATATNASTASVTTSWANIAQVQTIPTGCFTARVGLKLVTSAANTAAWDLLSVQEKIN